MSEMKKYGAISPVNGVPFEEEPEPAAAAKANDVPAGEATPEMGTPVTSTNRRDEAVAGRYRKR